MTADQGASPFQYPVSDLVPSAGPTPSQTVGPFFAYALPYEEGPEVAGPERAGAIQLFGRVLDGAGAPVPDALLEIWGPDENGVFVTEGGVLRPVGPDGFRGFGRAETDVEGRYAFRTVLPGAVPTAGGTAQAPHLAVLVFGRGMLRQVATRIYFPEHDHSTDPLLTALPADRRATLIASHEAEGYRFDVHLQGDQETVFLDQFAR